MMNFGKKFAVGVASAALVASLGGVVAPSAFAEKHSLPGFIAGLDRLSGPDRVATSLEVAAHEWGKRPDQIQTKTDIETVKRSWTAKRVYLASAEDAHMVDAATAGMLLDGPIVYVTNNVYVGTAVGNFLSTNLDKKPGFKGLEEVVPIGGESAIANSVAEAVAQAMRDNGLKKAKVVSALAGKDRYGTSVAIADYIYTASQNKEHDSYKWYGNYSVDGWPWPLYGLSDTHTGALNRAYFANGADSHIVDSMVAGTLDNGPILLVQPDGKLPESVVEFIKKTLPGEFGALGGTGAVPDATVSEAWQIKALANKWDSSYEIPGANKNVRELERLVYGAGLKNSTLLDSKNFTGLKKVIEKAEEFRGTWGNEVRRIENSIERVFVDSPDSKMTLEGAKAGVSGLLRLLYGDKIVDATVMSSDAHRFFKGDKDKDEFTGVNYETIEDSQAYQTALRKPHEDLEKMWKGYQQDSNMNASEGLSVLAAKLSQVRADSEDVNNREARLQTTYAGGGSGAVLKVVYQLADETVNVDKKWFEAAKKELGIAQGVLRGELDKIDAKSMIRLGGKDRFETAQLIANQWGKLYGAEMRSGATTVADHHFFEAYVANGHRLPDSLTAGQLTRGPIMLVRGSESNPKELSEFTAKVAARLQHWSSKKHPINLYGIGGTAVLKDSALQSVVDIANAGKVIDKDNSNANPTQNQGDTASALKFSKDVVKFAHSKTGVDVIDVSYKAGGKLPEGSTVNVIEPKGATSGKVTAKFDAKKSQITVNVAAAATAGVYEVLVTDGKNVAGKFKVVVAGLDYRTEQADNQNKPLELQVGKSVDVSGVLWDAMKEQASATKFKATVNDLEVAEAQRVLDETHQADVATSTFTIAEDSGAQNTDEKFAIGTANTTPLGLYRVKINVKQNAAAAGVTGVTQDTQWVYLDVVAAKTDFTVNGTFSTALTGVSNGDVDSSDNAVAQLDGNNIADADLAKIEVVSAKKAGDNTGEHKAHFAIKAGSSGNGEFKVTAKQSTAAGVYTLTLKYPDATGQQTADVTVTITN